jgi:hypothetical protein
MLDDRNRKNIISVIFILTLILSSMKIFAGVKCVVDIQLWDEADYLRNGTNYVFSSAVWGPFYTLFYFIQSLFQHDMIQLYYLNMSNLSVLVSISIFLFLKRLSVYSPIALLHIQNFAFLIILSTLLIATYIDKDVSRHALLATGALLASYIRPEYFIVYIFFLGWLVADLWRLGPVLQIRPNRIALGLLAILTFIWMPIKGLPVTSARSLIAFADWYFERNRGSDSNFTEVVQSSFGGARSFIEAILINPMEFFRHVIANMEQLPRSLAMIIDPQWERFTWLGLLFLAALFLIFAAKLIKKSTESGLSRHRFVLPACIVFGMPSLVSSIVFYPHERYLLPGALLLCLMAIVCAGRISRRTGLKTALSVSLILFLVAPTYTNPDAWFRVWSSPCTHARVLPNRATTEFIRGLNLKDMVLFSSEGFMYDAYLPGCRLVEVPEMLREDYYSPLTQSKHVDFVKFIEKKGINVIVTGDVRHPRFDWNEPTFQDFLINYEKYGFRKHTVPEVPDRIILVKS